MSVPDMKAYMRVYNKMRRERSRAAGLCNSCNKPSNGLVRCKACERKRIEREKFGPLMANPKVDRMMALSERISA